MWIGHRDICLSFIVVLCTLLTAGCIARRAMHSSATREPYVLILGIAQDAGYPQAACRKPCCEPAWADPSRRRLVSCLAIVDPISKERWLIDATPDFREQLHRLDASTRADATPQRGRSVRPSPSGLQTVPFVGTERSPNRSDLTGIFITHAHIGHYTGLQHLGREVIGDSSVPVYAMPRLKNFLSTSGPWSLLVSEKTIDLRDLSADTPVRLNERLTVTPFLVPHRDEFSETVGFRIQGPSRSVLFIPDIDKWERWDRRIEDEIRRCDVAYLDGTFFANGEIPGRDMSQIPHPFIEETLIRFAPLAANVGARIRFIHLNHTNPALDPSSAAARKVIAAGLGVAAEGERVPLGAGRDAAKGP